MAARLGGIVDGGEAFFPVGGLGAEFVLAQSVVLLFEFIDPADDGQQPAQFPLVLRPEDLLENPVEHKRLSSIGYPGPENKWLAPWDGMAQEFVLRPGPARNPAVRRPSRLPGEQRATQPFTSCSPTQNFRVRSSITITSYNTR